MELHTTVVIHSVAYKALWASETHPPPELTDPWNSRPWVEICAVSHVASIATGEWVVLIGTIEEQINEQHGHYQLVLTTLAGSNHVRDTTDHSTLPNRHIHGIQPIVCGNDVEQLMEAAARHVCHDGCPPVDAA